MKTTATTLALALSMAMAAQARAQYVGPVNPIAPPVPGGFTPTYPQPTYPSYPQPTYPSYPQPYPQPVNPAYPQPYPSYPQPTYPPASLVNPNGIAGSSGSSSMYWDPYRGWVTNTNNTTVLNSATSPGRAPAPGTSIQYYNYWNGTQWVRGSRWLGQDGQWHGEDQNTVVGPNGSVTNNTVYRSVNPNAGATAAPRTAPAPTQPTTTFPLFRRP